MFRTVGIIVVLAAGCSDSMLTPGTRDQQPNGWPAIEVEPEYLDFGELGAHESTALTFTVRSAGTQSSVLDVTDLTIEAIGSFTIMESEEAQDFMLPEGQEREFTVVFTPDHPWLYEGEITVHSNDRSSPATPVFLEGLGVMPELAISPDPLNLGTTNVGCTKEGEATLKNVGNADLRVTSLTENATTFSAIRGPAVPFTLPPEASVALTFQFTPDREGNHQGTLVAESNDALGRQEAIQLGHAEQPTQYVDRFSLDAHIAADIIFFVDQSPSTDDDQEALVDNFARFIARLSEVVPDWQVMVVTDDSGCSASGVLTPTTPDYVSLFTEAATEGRGGANTEAGFIVSYEAAMASSPGQCNAGFLRREALLHTIMVSDEPEQSPQPWDYYVRRFTELKGGDVMLYKNSAVAGEVPSGCSSDSNTAGPGTGYWEASQVTGGEFLSLCTDWASRIETLASASVVRSDYPLSSTPNPSTIVVRVNGVEVRGGWTYNPEFNSIEFAPGAKPHEGDEVTISYTEPAAC